jgi:hypothetical protein
MPRQCGGKLLSAHRTSAVPLTTNAVFERACSATGLAEFMHVQPGALARCPLAQCGHHLGEHRGLFFVCS